MLPSYSDLGDVFDKEAVKTVEETIDSLHEELRVLSLQIHGIENLRISCM
jgi:hypothetical protein